MKARHEFHDDGEYKEHLRIYFAAMAMQGLLSNSHYASNNSHPPDVGLGAMSLRCADELLKQLEK